MSVDIIDKLYQNYDVLNAATDKSKHESEYKEILDAAHLGQKEKKLAAQFIPKFHKHFPSLIETAIDRELDLCEDNDILIRRMAIKELPAFCKDAKQHTPRVSDILAQLLDASDPLEVKQVNASLLVLSKFDPIGTATGLFSQISHGDESTRLKCLQYVNSKFVKGGPEVFTKETEDFIINETKKLLQDVTADEFQQCIQILSSTTLGKTITGHQELVKLCVEQADLDTEVDSGALDEIVDVFLTCSTEALPFCSSQIEATAFVKFACEKFFPLSTWNFFIGATEADPAQTKLRLLKTFAELVGYCGALDKPQEKIEAIYKVLLEFLPLPDLNNDLDKLPSILFSHVECLLYALHTLGKQCPEYLAFADDEGKLKDFRDRLQYLARGNQGLIKKLQEEIKAAKGTSDAQSNEEKLKAIGLSTTSNIQTLIRELYHPAYKAIIRLSWVTPKKKSLIIVDDSKDTTKTLDITATATATKRHAPITFISDTKTEEPKPPKQARQMTYSSGNKNSPQKRGNARKFEGNRQRNQFGVGAGTTRGRGQGRGGRFNRNRRR